MLNLIIGIVLGVVFNTTWLMLWNFFKTTAVFAKLVGVLKPSTTTTTPPESPTDTTK